MLEELCFPPTKTKLPYPNTYQLLKQMVIGEIDFDTIYSEILKQLQWKNVEKPEISSNKDKITF